MPVEIPNAVAAPGMGGSFWDTRWVPWARCQACVCTQLWTSRTSRPKPTVPAQSPARRTARRSSIRRRRGSVRRCCGTQHGFILGGGQWGEPWDGLIQQQPTTSRLPAGDGDLRHVVHPPGAAGHLRQPAVPRGPRRAVSLGSQQPPPGAPNHGSDGFCAACPGASPAVPAAFSHFSEKCVMNNYFGIGLDAKISLEFNNKRDEHPKKCRLAATPPGKTWAACPTTVGGTTGRTGSYHWDTGMLDGTAGMLGGGNARMLEGTTGMLEGTAGTAHRDARRCWWVTGELAAVGGACGPAQPPRCAPQQPHQEHDVVRGAGHQGAAAAHLQEPGAAGAAGGTGPGPGAAWGGGHGAAAPRLSPLLQCDGVPISLPSLQGIAVLNIPSYAGGINFWGGTKEDNVSARRGGRRGEQHASASSRGGSGGGKAEPSLVVLAPRRTSEPRPSTTRSWRWWPSSAASRWPCRGSSTCSTTASPR